MGLLDKVTGIFSSGAADLVNSVGGVIDNLTTSKEEKEQLKIELTKVINSHTETIGQQANDVYQAELKDMQSARDANVRIQESDKASWWAKNTGYFLDVFLGLIWGTVTIVLVGKALKIVTMDVDMTAVLSIYTTVTAVFMIPLQFHRGTSAGSQAKQKQLDKMIG